MSSWGSCLMAWVDGWTGWTGWTVPKSVLQCLMGRVGRWSKASFNVLHTLWEYRTCIYILVYKIEIAANILMGFKIWCQVGVWVTLFSNYHIHVSFQIFGSKSRRISGTKEVCQRFFENSKKLLVFEFWWVVLIFDYAPTSLMGRVGWVGRKSKVSFNFLHTLYAYR